MDNYSWFQIYGHNLQDKDTHYEVIANNGSPENVTIQIREDIAVKFLNLYGILITKAEKFQVRVNLGENGQRIKQCQSQFKPSSHFIGNVESLEDIVLNN